MESLRQRYRVLREIPGPRSVAVFHAWDRVLGFEVALKTVPLGHALASDLSEEARRHHSLRHPGLVALTARFQDLVGFDDRPVVGFATRWADGPNVVDWAAGRSDVERLTAVAELCQTLDWLHRRGWLHLDVKPDNVVVVDDRPMLIDLGSALPLGAGSSTAGGTLGYAAPEVVAGEAPDVASDLFSLGVLLFRMLAGDMPFVGEGSALRRNVLDDRRLRLRDLRPDLDRGLCALVDALLSKVAADRPGPLMGVARQLGELGARPPSPLIPAGEAPWRGRDELPPKLDLMLTSGVGRPIAVVGPLGVGRERLVREHLAAADVSGGAWCTDVSGAVGGAASALVRLAESLGAPPGASANDPRTAAWAAGLKGLAGSVYVGRWSLDLEPHLALMEALSNAGLTVWCTAERVPRDCAIVAVPAVPTSVIRDLSVWLGVDGLPGAEVAAHEAGGNVGLFLARLCAPSVDSATFSDTLARVWPVLRALPIPISTDAVAALPAAVRAGMDEAVSLGLFRRSDRGLVPSVDIEPPEGPATADLKAAGAELLSRPELFTASERAVLAARTGHFDIASEWLSTFHHDYSVRADVAEVAERLLVTRDRHAIHLVAVQALKSGDDARREQVVELFEPDDPYRAIMGGLGLRRKREHQACYDSLMAWMERYGDHPLVRAEAVYTWLCTRPARANYALELIETWLSDPEIDPSFASAEAGLGAWILALCRTIDVPGTPERLRSLITPLADGLTERSDLGRRLLLFIKTGLVELSEHERSIAVCKAVVRRADEIGSPRDIAMARRRLGGVLMDLNRAVEARRYLLDAVSLYEQVGHIEGNIGAYHSLAEVEIGCLRLPAALRYLRAADALMDHVPAGPRPVLQHVARVLWASYHHSCGNPNRSVQLLHDVEPLEGEVPMLRTWRALVLMESYVDIGAFEQAIEVAKSLSRWPSPNAQRRLQLVKGRAHMGLARAHLREAVADLPEDPDPMVRHTVGMALLTAGGEDLDPDSFGTRRQQLLDATSWLTGPHRARAVALRERMLEGPGAGLDQIVQLIESMGDGPRMMEIVAQVVSEALSANRVLVMLRMPGLGRQLTSKEISGQESAGLAPEIWRRVRQPGDVWLAEDAFADPNLRRMSATVRTFQIKSVVAVAIPREGRVIGALYVDDVHRSGRFGAADVEILQRLAAAIGAVAEAMPVRSSRDGLTVHDLHGLYICDSDKAKRVRATLHRVERSEQSNLLLCGPTGVGKTWLARRIATEVLGLDGLIEVVMHPGPTEMLVSRLWGTRRGDFTGAVERAGAIFEAWRQNRALFIDELQNLDEIGQRVLLPLLELPLRRFGSLTSGVRELERPLHIILGTNAVVEGEAWSQVFREDLWYRISPIRIDLPPLSGRGREAIYRHLEDLLNERGLPAPEEVFERGALQRMVTHTWPGNLRTLANIAEQASLRFREDSIRIPASALEDMGLREEVEPPPPPTGGREAPALITAQARAVLEALERHDYMQSAAAEELGLSKYALHRKLKKLELLDHVREKRHARRRDG